MFSSLEHATSFARDLWFNKSPIHSWLNVFSAHLYIDQAAKFVPGPIMLELEQFGRKYRRKFGFVFITSTDKKLSHQILEEVKTRYENLLSVEFDITSREEFIIIERKLARLWDRKLNNNLAVLLNHIFFCVYTNWKYIGLTWLYCNFQVYLKRMF
ncbi:hypothetical protein Ahy_B09g097370 [Arachis hypogaea]|uniref:Oxo-4-hydroxy-4-carboxy-5-ureidoimidazoline decarboxylase domain-containing protein n=1 Tax=Arachis hypogaea TaxID=3818 RepID=A0A444XPJ7_ARAHY|nr:hypothetical protein Ahy_B09g097370 [Arachis hypogaea]